MLQAQVAAGTVEYEWSTGIAEFPTATLVVGAAAEEIAENDFTKYVDVAAGLDTNPGTQTQPVASVKQGYILVPGDWRKSGLLSLSPGVYNWAEFPVNNTGRMFGVNSSPLAVVGAFTTVFGPATVTAVNADGSVDVPGITALASGTGDSFAFATPTVTLTDAAAAFTVDMVGMSVTIAGATTPANNGTFLITGQTATTLSFHNPAGVAEAFAGTWEIVIDRFFGVPRMIIDSGPGAGAAAQCAGNTATALRPSVPLAGVAAGSVISLAVPSVEIQLSTNWAYNFANTLGFKGVKIKRQAGGNMFVFTGSAMFFEGCQLDFTLGGQWNIQTSKVASGFDAVNYWLPLGGNSPFSSLRGDSGVSIIGPASGVQVAARESSFYQATTLFKNAQFQIARGSVALLGNGCHGRNFTAITEAGGSLRVNGPSAAAKSLYKGRRSGTTTPFAFGYFSGAVGEMIHNVDITEVAGNPIQVGQDATVANSGVVPGRGGARLAVSDVSGSTRNTGVGIKYTKGSFVAIDAITGAPLTTVTGTLGDTEGRTTAIDNKTYAAVRTADANGVKGWPDAAAGTGNYLDRIEPTA